MCGSPRVRVLLELRDMPAQDGVVFDSAQEAAEAPVGDVRLARCPECGYVGNTAFDPKKIGFTEYRYAQHHSPKYQQHLLAVLSMLVEDYGIREKLVLDAGCGEGYFLHRLCEAGRNRGIGVDPSVSLDEAGGADADDDSDGITLIRDYFSADHTGHAADLVSCRHVIDELPEPRPFVELLGRAAADRPDAYVYIEVPNAMRTFEQKLVWNLGYAKRSWFTSTSIRCMFALCGLETVAVHEMFDGEYLGAVGRRAAADREARPPDAAGDADADAMQSLEHHVRDAIVHWTDQLGQWRAGGRRVAMWGAGMRGINFLSRFADSGAVQQVVDINPGRQGIYLPVSAARVQAPESLIQLRPDVVILSNPGYEQEIREQLSGLGLDAEIQRL
jgi:SAM-dependent methyltransferase